MTALPSSVLVFGATGLTGRHTVEVLMRAGHPTVAHVRPDSPRLAEWQTRFTAMGAQVDASPWEPTAIRSLFDRERPTHVFALLGTTQARAKKEGLGGGSAAYDAVDIKLTELLIEAALRQAQPPRFVYLSSVGAESGQGAYLAARKRIEDRLTSSALPYTILPYTIARPSSIVGERDDARAMERFGVPLIEGALRVASVFGAKKTAGRYRAITGEALAAALVRLAFDPTWTRRIAEREDLG